MDEYLDKLWEGIDLDKSVLSSNGFVDIKDAKDFEIVRCISHGCGKAGNVDTLWQIYVAIKRKLEFPNSSKYFAGELRELIKKSGSYPPRYESYTWEELYIYWDAYVVEKCEKIMIEVIKSAILLKDKDERCLRIIEEMPYINNVFCRVAICGRIKNPTCYLIDEDERVVKVAETRLNFERKWLNSSTEYKKQVQFLVTALEYGIITIINGLTNHIDNKISIKFESPLFNSQNECDYFSIDQDIVYNIADQRIIADVINELINQEKITLASGVLKNNQYLLRIRKNKNN